MSTNHVSSSIVKNIVDSGFETGCGFHSNSEGIYGNAAVKVARRRNSGAIVRCQFVVDNGSNRRSRTGTEVVGMWRKILQCGLAFRHRDSLATRAET